MTLSCLRSPTERTSAIGVERPHLPPVHFEVWAPQHASVELVIGAGEERVPMQRDERGYWSVSRAGVSAGTLYGYALDHGRTVLADPRSRFQPDGPHGLSEVIDASSFAWSDAAWSGVQLRGSVLYELHVGTFTHEGTWDAARLRLPELAALGVTVIELMPVAEFSGRFGWGYDGVNLYAPYHVYGRPDDLRRFIDVAHALGVGVIMDVVYNHVGPDGNHLPEFSPRYFSARKTEWGAAFNYDGDDSRPVRDFIAGNAEYWVRDYHLDGLRLDATQSIFDDSREHILAELARRARAAAGGRSIVLIAENEPQETDLVRSPERGGYGLDALWNDDFHHSAMVALLGQREAYYTDYLGRAQEFVACMKHGYLYQGQPYAWQQKRRGSPAFDLAPRSFVAFLENHDQVANTPGGERLRYLTQPGAHRALTAMLLLGPWTPMLFQGQEWGSERPFTYFADFSGKLAESVQLGRCEALKQFPSYASRAVQDAIPAPSAEATFESSKLDWRHGTNTPIAKQMLALHRDLLALRREDRTLKACIGGDARRFEAAVLCDRALVLRYFGDDGADRLLTINLGGDYELTPAPEPLLAPPRGAAWQRQWSSEEPRYGGHGAVDGWRDTHGWRLPAYSAMLFNSCRDQPEPA